MRLKSIYKSVFLTTVVVLAGCSGDEFSRPAGSSREAVAVTLTVSRPGDSSTRTILDDREDGGLSSLWRTGDHLLVVNADGSKTWELTLEKGAGESRGVFSGTVDGVTEGAKYRVWYLGDSNNGADPYTGVYTYEDNCLECVLGSTANLQGLKDDLVRADLLTAEIELTVGDDSKARSKNEVEMQPQLAMAHFTLTGLPEGLADDADARLTVSNIVNGKKQTNVAYYIAMNSAEWRGPRSNTDGGFTIDNRVFGQGSSNTTAEVYLALFPDDYKLTFELTSGNGDTYGYTFPTATQVEAGRYYAAATGQTGEISCSGIQVPMTEDGGEVPDYSDYENEDPNNPLHKFAKTNLTREGDETNTFADANDNGALYQWGRNHGYVDTKGIYENSTMIDGSPWPVNLQFSNFIDAMGSMSYDSENRSYGIMDYFVYSATGQYNNCNITCGTAMHHSDSFYFDEPSFYSSVEDIKSHKDRYFMDGTPGEKIRGYGSYYFGMDELDNKADYWVSSFGEGGSTWSARAQKCGYDNPNPCPVGWRLPTAAEMREIAPEGSGLDESNGFLSTMLSGYSELRETSKGIRYAIRWLYDSDAITIEAVVVDGSYTDRSQLTTLFWDQQAGSKVVRKFPFTGMIRPFVGACDAVFNRSVYICRPYHFGLADFGAWPLTVGYYDYYYGVVGTQDNNFNSAFGGYWVEEKNVAFKFATRDIATKLAYSCLLVESAEPVMGYAIRPVMAK